jgi:hypothetical protein
MSVDTELPTDFPAEEPKKKGTRKTKVRKHLLTTAYKQDVAARLDKLEAAGHKLGAIVPSSDVRGFEIITVFEE